MILALLESFTSKQPSNQPLKKKMNTASNVTVRLMGEDDKFVTQHVSSPAKNVEDWADTSERMIAVTWQGKNKVAVCE